MKSELTADQNTALLYFAAKYIWWKEPAEAIRYPKKIVSQVMNIGTIEDLALLQKQIPNSYLVEALTTAEIGQFTEKSWSFWHYMLGLSDVNKVPAPPARRFEDDQV